MARSIHICALGAALLCTSLAAMSCDRKGDEAATTTTTEATASTEAPADNETRAEPADEAPEAAPAVSIDTAATLEQLAARLPADTMAIALLDVNGTLESDLVAAIGGRLSDAQRKAFREDIGAFLEQRLGVDPTDAAWIAVGVGAGQWVAAITPGPLALADGLEPVEIGSVKGTRLTIDDAAVFDLGDGWQAVVPSSTMIGALLPAPTETLASTETWTRMKKVTAVVGGGVLVVADLSNPLVKAAARDLPAPLRELDAVAISLRGGLALAGTASSESIERLETLFGELQQKGRSSIDAMYAGRDGLDMGQGLLAIVGHHLYDPLVASSKPSFEGDLVTLDLRGDDLQTAVALLGVSAAIAVPAFQQYISKSKTSEAELNLKALADGARAYHLEEHVDDPSAVGVVTGVYPEAPQPVCTAPFDPQGARLSPDATEWTEAPWSELRFQVGHPHYFQYCYQSSPDRKAFAVSATAALSGGGAADTRLCLRGQTSDDGPTVARPETLDPTAPCTP